MPTYLFQLGHCPDLSHAEILGVNPRFGGALHSPQRLPNAVICKTDSEETIHHIFNELGGAIRLCEVIHTLKIEGWNSVSSDILVESILAAKLDSILMSSEHRAIFGLTFLGDSSAQSPRKLHNLLHETAVGLKNHLREKECSCRFVLPDPNEKRVELSGAQVDKNNLLEKGLEIVFHFDGQQTLILGLTKRIQAYEEFSQRDYGRPQRDARSGMLPPKLARMMINLARTDETKTILDPFCGSGGILMEASLAGLGATGFDNSEKAVNDSLENRKWLENRFPDLHNKIRVFHGDACSLHSLCEPLYFDACVTEPYLGPPVTQPLNETQFEKISHQLEPLYIRALGEIRAAIKPGGRVVFITPRFRLQDSTQTGVLSILREIKLLGYTILDPFAEFQSTDRRATLIYERPKQVVLREIFVLKS
ncbi:MAG: hypothetical protein C4527_29160 [Candidatus Omnitrophota bacterium]|jgi:tRNA G10  N-methylase Trm11|nr:MAG: hypothetical protein C4527_29160 [Candidatus Omnitrophota bacterium]